MGDLTFSIDRTAPNDNATAATLVVRQGGAMLAIRHKKGIDVPGGKREPGDGSTARTAVRECREETGLRGTRVSFLMQMQVGDHLCDIYEATRFVDDGKPTDDPPYERFWATRDEMTGPGSRFPDMARALYHFLDENTR